MAKRRKGRDCRLIFSVLISRFFSRLVVTFCNLLLLIGKDLSLLTTDENFKRSNRKHKFSAIFIIFLILIDSAIAVNACDIKPCTDALSRELSSLKATSAKNIATCLLLKEYSACLALYVKSCHGNLIYLSLQSITQKSMQADCPELMAQYERDNPSPSAATNVATGGGTASGQQSEGSTMVNGNAIGGQRLNLPYTTYNGPAINAKKGRCLFPYQRSTSHRKGGAGGGDRSAPTRKSGKKEDGRGGNARTSSSKSTAGYRYCVAFGDPHLRTFDGQHDTCRVLNAWPLVDNAYLTVQLFGERLSNGLNASAITKVSIIIKALPGCTEQKQFTASLEGTVDDFLPTAFDDGTVHSGEPSTSNGDTYSYDYNDGRSHTSGARVPPALFIEDVAARPWSEGGPGTGGESDDQSSQPTSSRVDIHLRYVATRVIVRRTGHFLSVAIKMPVEALSHESTLSAWQLCLASCPLHERIDYKRVLARPREIPPLVNAASSPDSDHTPGRLWDHSTSVGDAGGDHRQEGVAKGAAKLFGNQRQVSEQQRRLKRPMDRNQAVEACRGAQLTDFFFDACVFDLIVSGGDLSFRDAARFALEDIRRYYPPYIKHYQTNRADLAPYLAMYENEEELPAMDGTIIKGSAEFHPNKLLQPLIEGEPSLRDQRRLSSKGGGTVVRASALLSVGFVFIAWLVAYYCTVNR